MVNRKHPTIGIPNLSAAAVVPVHDGAHHTPLGRFFQARLLDKPRGCQRQYRTIRRQKALGKALPTPTFLVPTLYPKLWRYRAWNTGAGVCYIHRPIRYCCTSWFKLNDGDSLPHECRSHYVLECHVCSIILTDMNSGRG